MIRSGDTVTTSPPRLKEGAHRGPRGLEVDVREAVHAGDRSDPGGDRFTVGDHGMPNCRAPCFSTMR